MPPSSARAPLQATRREEVAPPRSVPDVTRCAALRPPEGAQSPRKSMPKPRAKCVLRRRAQGAGKKKGGGAKKQRKALSPKRSDRRGRSHHLGPSGFTAKPTALGSNEGDWQTAGRSAARWASFVEHVESGVVAAGTVGEALRYASYSGGRRARGLLDGRVRPARAQLPRHG